MSQLVYFGSAGASGANQNLDVEEEWLGFAADGATTLVQSGGTNNTKGSWTAIGTSTEDWAGFVLYLGPGSASSARYLVDIRVGGVTVVPDLYIEPNQGFAPIPVFLPLAITAGLFEARIQAENSNRTLRIGIVGFVRSAQSAPMYSTMTALNVDVANTRASASDIALQGSGGTTYGTLSASLAASYGAFLFSPGGSGAVPATSQQLDLHFATGAAAAEADFARHSTWITNTAASFLNRAMRLVERTIASGARLSVKPVVATPGTDTMRLAAYGFSP